MLTVIFYNLLPKKMKNYPSTMVDVEAAKLSLDDLERFLAPTIEDMSFGYEGAEKAAYESTLDSIVFQYFERRAEGGSLSPECVEGLQKLLGYLKGIYLDKIKRVDKRFNGLDLAESLRSIPKKLRDMFVSASAPKKKRPPVNNGAASLSSWEGEPCEKPDPVTMDDICNNITDLGEWQEFLVSKMSLSTVERVDSCMVFPSEKF